MVKDIIAANSGHGPKPRMPDKLDYQSIQIAYDAEEDILYLTFASARPGTTVDNPNGAWWRIDSETGEIYGVEIPGFERYFLTHFADAERIAQHWYAFRDQKAQDDESRVHFAVQILKLVGLVDGHAASISSTEEPERQTRRRRA